MSDTREASRCARCGRSPRDDEPLDVGVPGGWEGSPVDAVCPGCQYAEWHPLCEAILDQDGGRVAYAGTLEDGPTLEPAIAAMPPEELEASRWAV